MILKHIRFRTLDLYDGYVNNLRSFDSNKTSIDFLKSLVRPLWQKWSTESTWIIERFEAPCSLLDRLSNLLLYMYETCVESHPPCLCKSDYFLSEDDIASPLLDDPNLPPFGMHQIQTYVLRGCQNSVKVGKSSIHLYEGNPINLYYPLEPVFRQCPHLSFLLWNYLCNLSLG